MADLRALITHFREVESVASPTPRTWTWEAVAASRDLFAPMLDVVEAALGRLEPDGCTPGCDTDFQGRCDCGHAALSFSLDRLAEAMEATRARAMVHREAEHG